MFHLLEKRVQEAFQSHIAIRYGIQTQMVMEQPKQADFGELAVPIAFQLAKQLRQAPKKIAQELVAEIGPIEGIAAMEVAGAGYINIRFDRAIYARGLMRVPGMLDAEQSDEKIIVDTRHARWASPYGLTALLALAQSRAERPILYVPEADNVSSYWSRMDFFKHAAELYELQGRVRSARAAETSVLLEVTSISKSDDVHDVVDKIQQRAQDALVKNLNLDAKITMRFTMALSGQLGSAGLVADKLETTATLTFERLEARWTVTQIHLDVRG